jgi:leucine dehydrogenase
VSDETARGIRARVVAGAANNQLASAVAGRILADRGVLYVPDFVANAGAVIVGFETGAGRAATALATGGRIAERVDRVCTRAAADGTTTVEAAVGIARERLARAMPARFR